MQHTYMGGTYHPYKKCIYTRSQKVSLHAIVGDGGGRGDERVVS